VIFSKQDIINCFLNDYRFKYYIIGFIRDDDTNSHAYGAEVMVNMMTLLWLLLCFLFTAVYDLCY